MIDYNARYYRLESDTLRRLMQLDPSRSSRALMGAWAALILLITAMRFWVPREWAPYLYVPVIFLIAGRFGVLLQLIHEASHRLLSRSRETNDAIARWFCAFPVGVFYDGYVAGHMRHHSGTNTDEDPIADREKYRVTDRRNPDLYLLFLKDLLGITAVSIFFAYQNKEGRQPNETAAKGKALQTFLQLCFVQLVILGGLFQFSISEYILYWLIPAVSPHMFLMRVRGIAEHGLSGQLHVSIHKASEGNLYTRSFLTPLNSYRFKPLIWIEKLLIGSLSVHYHHEHHLLPTVPYYHLAEVHRLIGPAARSLNPDIYAKGYFAAAFRRTETATAPILLPSGVPV